MSPAPRHAEQPVADATDATRALVLDPKAVEQLRQLDPGGSSRLIARVAVAYRESAERLVPQIREALSRGDHAGVRMVAHTLKSSSQNVGAQQLAQLCAAVETMVRTGAVEGLESAVHALCAEVALAVDALGQLDEVRE